MKLIFIPKNKEFKSYASHIGMAVILANPITG